MILLKNGKIFILISIRVCFFNSSKFKHLFCNKENDDDSENLKFFINSWNFAYNLIALFGSIFKFEDILTQKALSSAELACYT